MDTRGGTNIPRRIGSAPMERHQHLAALNNRSLHGSMRGGLDKHSHGHAFPPSGGFFDRVNSASEQASGYPASCIYDVTEFAKLHGAKDMPPTGILAFVKGLWNEMPENKDKGPEFITRDEFKDVETMFPSKILKDRKIHNEVLGILGRVNGDNFEKMKEDLTNLPIRQSSQEVIQQVIQVFFNKSIQPEDSIFTPLYVKLIRHLINTIGGQEIAGKFIHNAIIRQCQNTFENAEVLQKQLEEEIKDLHPDEAELRRTIFAGKQKANINFLGLLFTHGIVRESVVVNVLEWLLYGRESHRRHPADYELIHFMDLLLACGNHFKKEGLEHMPFLRCIMEDFIQTHPSQRIRFLFLNTVETMENGWEPRYGAKAAQRSESKERRQQAPAPLRNKTLTMLSQKPTVSLEEFRQAMDNFFVTSRVDEVVTLLSDIPMETRIKYCSSAIGRYITNLRYVQQRARLGELFEELSNKRVLPIDKGREALLQHLREAVDEDLFTDIPKYFSNWASVIRGGREVFPHSLHTEFLNILVDRGARREAIVDMVRDVRDALGDRPPPAAPSGRDAEAKERFRVLPAALRFVPPLCVEGDMDESEDILKHLREYDKEVEYFYQLYEQMDSTDFFTTSTNISKHTQLTFQFISAFFTFVRYDVEALCRMYKDALKKVINSRQLHMILDEVYATWGALERTPEQSYFQFVKALCVDLGLTRDQKGNSLAKEQLEKHKTLLRSLGQTGKNDASMLDKLMK